MNFNDFELRVTYKYGGVVRTTIGESEHYAIKTAVEGDLFKLWILPKTEIELVNVEMVSDYTYGANDRVFANGYQSWTVSREFAVTDKQKGLFPLKNRYFHEIAGATGDYDFAKYGGKGFFHSCSYGYIRDVNENDIVFIGSLTERQGYTFIYYDMKKNTLSVTKDVEGLTISDEYQLYDLISLEGDYDVCFDKYIAAMNLPAPKLSHLSGYTSWYNYYQKIDEETMYRDLEGLYEVAGDKATIFQIDDGSESMVGDWHKLNEEKFPNGLRPIVDKIHSKGYMAGLWLAPFSAQYKAKIVEEHPEWLIRHPDGRLVLGGFAWGGFYVLDMYNDEARAYIKSIFDEVFNDFDFDMVKLDFLYSQCIIPRNNKTRGQIMCEAMDFLRECCGDKLILGCGVPMVPAFGKVDACRISSDVENSFKDKFYVHCTNQEIISAKNAMNNSIFRRHLNKRVWLNDPDVFFIRNDGPKVPKFTWEQKMLLARINHIFGDVLFVSDNCGNFDDKQKAALLEAFAPFEGKVIQCCYQDKNHISVTYIDKDEKYVLVYNTNTGANHLEKLE